MKNPIEYGIMLCDTMMSSFAAVDLPPKGKFHYHQGVMLSGMEHIFQMCGDEKYFEYIKAYIDNLIDEDGSIPTCGKESLDDHQPGILLYGLYKKTGDEKYKKAIDRLVDDIRVWKKNPAGGFWHKERYPNQMWLDSLYMGGPIQAMYAANFGDEKLFYSAAEQAIIMKDNMQDKNNGLMRHAWSYDHRVPWCDIATGLAPECWGRAQGWYVVAILDILELMPKNNPMYKKLEKIEKEIIECIAKYQDMITGMWHQVVNMPHMPDNWIETSCSCLFAYAMAKGVRLGVLDKEYLERAKRAFAGIITHGVDVFKDKLFVERVCIGTGVGTYNYYTNRPTVQNDLHGAGVMLLLCAELAKTEM